MGFNAVCDDEQADKEEIAKMTEEICNEEQISSVITCFDSAKKLLEEIKRGQQFCRLIEKST